MSLSREILAIIISFCPCNEQKRRKQDSYFRNLDGPFRLRIICKEWKYVIENLLLSIDLGGRAICKNRIFPCVENVKNGELLEVKLTDGRRDLPYICSKYYEQYDPVEIDNYYCDIYSKGKDVIMNCNRIDRARFINMIERYGKVINTCIYNSRCCFEPSEENYLHKYFTGVTIYKPRHIKPGNFIYLRMVKTVIISLSTRKSEFRRIITEIRDESLSNITKVTCFPEDREEFKKKFGGEIIKLPWRLDVDLPILVNHV